MRKGNDVGNSIDRNSWDDDSLRSAGLAFTRDVGRHGSQSVVPRFTNDELELPQDAGLHARIFDVWFE